VLQDGVVQRVGSTQGLQVDVRVVAATNQDLEHAIAIGRFRSDLYYRVSVFPIRIPPLRERRDDIPILAEYFTKHFASRLRKAVTGLAPDALHRLTAYDWPGNVRELQNVIERALILTAGALIESDAIGLGQEHGRGAQAPPVPGVLTLADAERQAIVAALDRARWRVSGRGGAAELLALKPTTLHAKMKKLGIHRPV
jgi:transcriptional regulator with GAF, ATPase, and Fis domain